MRLWKVPRALDRIFAVGKTWPMGEVGSRQQLGCRNPGAGTERTRYRGAEGARAWEPGAGTGDARAPGAGLAAWLLLPARPGRRGLSWQLLRSQEEEPGRGGRSARSRAAPRVQRRRRPHGAQRALLDHRTPSTARARRSWGRGGPRGLESPLATVTLGRPRGRSTRLPVSDPGEGTKGKPSLQDADGHGG